MSYFEVSEVNVWVCVCVSAASLSHILFSRTTCVLSLYSTQAAHIMKLKVRCCLLASEGCRPMI